MHRNTHWNPVVLLVAAALLLTLPVAAREADPYRLPGTFDRDLALTERARIHSQLVSEMVAEGLANPIVVVVDDDAIQSIEAPATVFPAPTRVGVVAAAGTTISFSGLTARDLGRDAVELTHGAIRGTADGGFVYTARIEVPGASALRVHFDRFWLPSSAQLWLYTADGEVFGPYRGTGRHGDGEFWSHSLLGEEAIVQIRQAGPIKSQDLQDIWFDVADVGYLGERFIGIMDDGYRSFCTYNAPCIENASCGGTSAAVNDAKDAVAHYQWVSGAFLAICSGGLVADTAGSGAPYFLTANHCVSRGKDARSVETFFQYSVPCGTTNCDDVITLRNTYPQSLRTSGSQIVATGSTGDYTLLLLDEPAPAGSAFMGWNDTPVAFSNGTSLYRISHPDGAPQAYTEHSVNTSAGQCQGIPRGSWIYSRDTFGATDGGSSGAPVVNGAGQVVGQLTGACGTNLNDVCDSTSNATIDGAFAAYFSAVAPYLDNGSCTPSTEVCNDGNDNDCDGDVDCNDADCSGDPACSGGTCGGNGDACSTGADCCSGNCKRGSCKGN